MVSATAGEDPADPSAVPAGLAALAPLSPVELQLCEAARNGRALVVDPVRPGAATDANRIRAEVVRYLAIGGCADCLVHARGVGVSGAVIVGDIDLTGCECGRVSLRRCLIDGTLIARGATLPILSLDGSWITRLSLARVTIHGDIFLRDGFRVDRGVDLLGATIRGNLECSGGHFIAGPGEDDDALDLDGAEITDGFFWREVAIVDGSVRLTAAHVGSLVDDIESWRLANRLYLDGFRYDRIVGRCPSAERIEWLEKGLPTHAERIFVPQPWEQAVRILREMGHPEQARNVAIAREWRRLSTGAVGDRSTEGVSPFRRKYHRLLNWLSRRLHFAYGILAGFGYRPLWTIGWMIAVWLTLALGYFAAEERGVFGPSSAVIQTAAATAACGAPGDPGKIAWTRCPDVPSAYTTFNPWIYSLDLLLPIVDLQQQNEWSPMITNARSTPLWWGIAARWALWFEILFGWTSSALLIAVLGKLMDKD